MGVVRSSCGHAKKHPYLWLHVAYFLLFSIVGALSIWVSPKPKSSPPLSFVDALFSAVSAVTETGLGSVEMHRFSLSDQLTLLLLMLVGSQVFTSAIPLFISSLFYSSSARPSHTPLPCTHIELPEGRSIKRVLSLPIIGTHTSFEKATHSLFQPQCKHREAFLHTSVSILPSPKYAVLPSHLPTKEDCTHRDFPTKKDCPQREASLHTSVSIPPSKCAFLPCDFPTKKYCTHAISIEDKALALMSWITICYFICSIMVGFLICQVSILLSPHALGVLEQSHVNSSLFSLFSTVSAFANCGFILLDENLVPMQRSMIMLICLCALILMGNTLYAPTMRLVICVLHKLAKGDRKKVYQYILNVPRRHFTHLFPQKETTWLVGTVVVINAFQMICILGLDWKSQALKGLGIGYKVVAALFQAVTTRSAGMNVVNLSGFSTSTLLVSLGSMYIASYPIYLTKKEKTKRCDGFATKSKTCMLMQQLPKFRAQDSFLFFATFLICIFERDSIKNDPLNFSFFNIIFEVISAYGNVGLTIGYSCGLKMITTTTRVCIDTLCSLSGRWSVCSKLVLMVVMVVGRQKALNEDVDWDISPSHS